MISSIGERERERRRENLRNWLTNLWRLTSPNSTMWAGRLEKEQSADDTDEVPAFHWQESLLLRGGQVFILSRPSTDWTGPAHMMEGSLLYSKSTEVNVYLTPKPPHRNIQNNV